MRIVGGDTQSDRGIGVGTPAKGSLFCVGGERWCCLSCGSLVELSGITGGVCYEGNLVVFGA